MCVSSTNVRMLTSVYLTKISENVEKDSYIRNNMESVEAPITEILGKINIRWVIIQSYESPTWSYMPL